MRRSPLTNVKGCLSGMGQLFASLRKENKKEACALFLDFENAVPTPEEEEVYTFCTEQLKDGQKIIEHLRGYEGTSADIRQAIENPEMEEVAWEKILPKIEKLKEVYEYSANLEAAVPRLLTALCMETPTTKTLDARQALTKQFAEIIDLALTVDDLKTSNPAIQNDFSFYRRIVARMGMSAKAKPAVVKDDLANKMSLFYAYPNPFITCTVGIVSNLSEQGTVPLDNIGECLSVMSEVCRGMVENSEFVSRLHSQDTVTLCMRVMTGCIVLFDHIQPSGAFHRKSKVDVRSAIRLLKEHQPQTENLLNALRFSTKHLQDPTTPRAVRAMLK